LNISVRKLYRREYGQADFIWYREGPLKFKLMGKEVGKEKKAGRSKKNGWFEGES